MKISYWIYSGLIPVIFILSVSCSRETTPADDPDVLVRMGEYTITVSDLDLEAARCRSNGTPFSSKKELLEQLIEFKSQVLKARSMGVEKDASVERRIEKIIVAELHKKKQALPDVIVDEEELKMVYEAQVAKYTRPAADRLSILCLQLEKSDSPAKRIEVRKKIDEAKIKADIQPLHSGRGPSMQGFAQLSMTYSDDQVSRYRGGDIGWSSRDIPSARIPEAVWKVGISLEKGKVSDVLETPQGFYLVKKTDYRPESVTPFKDVRISIRKKILAERRLVVENDFIGACVTWAAPKRNEARIAQLADKQAAKNNVAGKPVSPMGVPRE